MVDMVDQWELESHALEAIFVELNLGEDLDQWPALDADTKKRIQKAARAISSLGWVRYKVNGNYLGKQRKWRVFLAIHGGLPTKKVAWLISEVSRFGSDESFYGQLLALVFRRGDRFAAALTRELIQQAGDGVCMYLALDLRYRLDLDTEFTPGFAAIWASYMNWRSEESTTEELGLVLKCALELFTLACTAPGDNESFVGTAKILVAREIISAEVVIPLVIQNLSVVSRPLDRRRVWETIAELNISESEIRVNYRSFLPALSAGDGGSFYEQLIPRLLDPADDGDARLLHVVFAAMQTTTKKARKQLIGWLINRRAPLDKVLSTQVLEILAEQDPRDEFAKERVKLEKSWGVTTPVSEASGAELIPWTQAPELWTIEPFLPDDTNDDAQLLIETLGKQSVPTGTNVHIDQALALIQRMEQSDAGSAALICAGMPKSSGWDANAFAEWGRGEMGETYHFSKNFEWKMLYRIKEVPLLLSTPRDVSLVINLDDFIAKLESYGNRAAIFVDVRLAVTRLDIWYPDHASPSQEQLDRLSQVQAVFFEEAKSEDVASLSVSEWVLHALEEEPGSTQGYWAMWNFPAGGAKVLDHSDTQYATNLAQPWDSAMASAVFSAFSSQYSEYVQLAEESVAEGYARGLLLPGVVDVQLLEKTESGQIAGMVNIAEALLNLVFEEDMLAVAWLLLRDIVDYSAGDARMASGLKRVLEVMDDLAPSVFTQEGVPDEAKDIAGIRKIAQRSGSAAAVKIARKIVAQVSEDQAEESFPPLPAAHGWWAGRNPGIPVVEDNDQEDWMNRTSISRQRLETKMREMILTDSWETKNRLTSIARSVEPVAFAQVAAGVISEMGSDSIQFARWITHAFQQYDDGSSAGPQGVVSRSWPTTRYLLAWVGQQPKALRETRLFLDVALLQAPEVVQAVADGQADARELDLPGLDLLEGKSEKIASKVAYLKAWLKI
ncbi:hypothetical protein [Corynebacterium crudilactis]|uniref:Uncharacterized protein n=1 Tax=Corynebacterium crudilactis TaxID=1652495 RepID=A0A172QWK9_9CORY|nr:hypothetical protein [Corynebacterium crudilactis]ANE05010.1 hypothetical protein ccrud_12920 [Corynebacterium crudilactis]